MKTAILCVMVIACSFSVHPYGRCSADENATVIAVVNGDVVTESELLERIRSLHLNKPSISPERKARDVDLFGLVDTLINDRLMVQEARRVGLDNSELFLTKVDALVKKESVLKLRKEVLDQADVSDAEVIEYLQTHRGNTSYSGKDLPERLRKRVEKKLRKENEKKLSQRFFSKLRQNASIWIDETLVRDIKLEQSYAGEKDVIGRVNGQPITVDEFISELMQMASAEMPQKSYKKRKQLLYVKATQSMKGKVVDRLVTFLLIEQEALRRDYMMDPDFAKRIERAKERLLVNAFKAELVYPLAIPKEEDLKRYYRRHPDLFKEGYEVWIREMRFSDKIEAEKILEELKEGASFDYLATQVSETPLMRKESIWIRIDRFPRPVRDVLENLQVGEFSDVIHHGRQFKIVKLKGKRGGKTIPYDKVVEQIRTMVGQEQFENILSEYLARLRKGADIRIRHDILRDLETRMLRAPVGESELVPERPGEGNEKDHPVAAP